MAECYLDREGRVIRFEWVVIEGYPTIPFTQCGGALHNWLSPEGILLNLGISHPYRANAASATHPD